MYWNEVKYQPELAKTFLGSPSILRLPDGVLLASHDYFGLRGGSPRNHESEESLTSIYRSEDDGVSWVNVNHIMNCFWSNLFLHKGSVYNLGASQQYGSIVIRRSDDGGFTWTHPKDEKTGLLFKGGTYHDAPNYHCAPMPVLEHNGRLYRAFEDCTEPVNKRIFDSLVISVAVDADLLDASNWTMSNNLSLDLDTIPSEWGQADTTEWIEGNIVVGPDGELCNILRLSRPLIDHAAIVKIHDDGKRVSFDPATGFIDFPGGGTKFTIRQDPQTGLYLSLVNNNTDPNFHSQRNVLSLSVSEDLINWRLVKTLMTDDTGLSPEDSIRLTGFQYVDWQFDGDDIIYLVRAAYRGAVRFHDSNRILYCKQKDFRALL